MPRSSRLTLYFFVPFAMALLLSACSQPPAAEDSAPKASSDIPTIVAELIASDASWGTTEGPAVDSEGTLFFTSRGAYKGIVKWEPQPSGTRYADVATGAGPNGLWIDGADNIYATASDEREVLKLSPSREVTVIAKGFEADPSVAKGPNDIVVSRSGVVYFTDPNGYDGSAPPGTVYRIGVGGKVSVFDDSVVGPNGIALSEDERTLYVANNVAEAKSNMVRWPLNEEGEKAGEKELVAEIEPCVADGMTVDRNGHVWLTCFSYGTAHLIDPETGGIVARVTTEQKSLTNCIFGQGDDNHSLYLTSSDTDWATGYVYRAEVETPGFR